MDTVKRLRVGKQLDLVNLNHPRTWHAAEGDDPKILIGLPKYAKDDGHSRLAGEDLDKQGNGNGHKRRRVT